MNAYPTLVFDAGGTLLQLDLDALARTYVATARAADVEVEFAAARAVVGELEREIPARQQTRIVSLEHDNGKLFWDEFFGDGFRRLGVTREMTPAVTEIRERFQRAEYETIFADVLPTLAALTARGVRLGILSNFSPNLENVLRQVGIHQYFTFFVVSAIAGVEKPDPRIFDLTVRAAACAPTAMAYIGDSIFHDIEGAQRAGIAAILVDRQDRYPAFRGARVRDLRELVT